MTTTTESPQITKEFRQLLKELRGVIDESPFSGGLSLLVTPSALDERPGSVFVEEVESEGNIRLVQKDISDVTLDDVLFTPQVTGLDDQEFAEYVDSPRLGSCLVRYDLRGNKVHVYD